MEIENNIITGRLKYATGSDNLPTNYLLQPWSDT